MESVRRAVVPVTFDVLEKALGFDTGMLRIVEVLPKREMTYRIRLCELVVEGPLCPVVREGERYQTRELDIFEQPDGSREAELR